MDGYNVGAWPLLFSRVVTSVAILLVITACGGTSEPNSDGNKSSAPPLSTVSRADWDARSLLLTVSGTWSAAAPSDAPLLLSDADSGEVLMDVPLSAGQTGYTAVIEDLTSVPCAIAISQGRTQVRRVVANAPPNCVDLVAVQNLALNVRQAVWRSARGSLNIVGVNTVPNIVTLTYTDSSTVLAAVPVNDRIGRTLGLWRIHLVGLDATRVPCSLRVTAGTETEIFGVQDAPASCIGNPVTPPPASNQAPSGRIVTPAAPATIAAGESVTFAGDGTDTDNNLPLTYEWDFAGGATASTLQNPGPVVFATAGSYAVKLTVRDSLGLADANPPTLLVTVTGTAPPTNQAPSGRIVTPAAPATITAGESVTFAGDGTDTDNNLPLTYEWDFAGGATASTLQNPGPVVFATAGSYAVKLTVRDSLGLADANPPTLLVTVTGTAPPTNQAPSGRIVTPAAPATIAAGESVTFAGDGTDTDNNLPLTYEWDFAGGATASTLQNPGPVVFATAGSYAVKLTVRDSLGLADANPPTLLVTVTGTAPPSNQAPSGRIVTPAAPATIVAGESVTFAGDGTDTDNNLPLTYEWDFAGGATASTLQNPGPIVFATAGSYAVKLTVRDSLGLADANPPTLLVTVTGAVTAAPPSGAIVEPAADTTVVAGSAVTFRGSATDPASLAVTYQWHFGGGAPESEVQDPGAVIFATPGIYPVTMNATNSAGLADPTPETRTITVSAAQAPPVVIGAALFGAVTPDNDFSVASWMPLGNSLRAQVVQGNILPSDKPTLLADSAVKMVYAAQADAKASITTTSVGKTNFWPEVNTSYLFMLPPGVTLVDDQGLQGTQNLRSQAMPGTTNTPQLFGSFDATASLNAFTARAIPVVPLDDANQRNNYPLFRMSAQDVTSSAELAFLDTVLAVGDEQDCATGCHATGGNAADAAMTTRLGGAITWSTNTNLANQAKDNIWIIHNALFGTPPSGTTQDACARCHYTPSADPDGLGPQGTQQLRRPWLADALHRVHGLGLTGTPPSTTVPPVMADDQCGRCHEAGGAKLSRGAMLTAGQVCTDCHGGMLALAAQFQLTTTPPRARLAFVDQPRCESCHIGDNLTVTTGPLVLRQAFDATDPAATPRLAPTSRYAQEPAKLFSDSVGHGNVACIGCHGSTHAEWPVTDVAANDNVTPMLLQGHRGVLTECTACHVGGVNVALMGGPHGLHAVNDPGWVAQHAPVYTADPNVCKACHGATLDGSYLSRAATDRSFLKEDGTAKLYGTGEVVGCADCHVQPL